MDGIENLIGMHADVQFRFGQREGFADPATGRSKVFKPGYFAIIREEERTVDKKSFWVKEEQLFFGEDKAKIRPYMAQDYVLYKFESTDLRRDYSTFDFHEEWEIAQNQMIGCDKEKATSTYDRVIELLFKCPDLVLDQKTALAVTYRNLFLRISAAHDKKLDPRTSAKELLARTQKKSLNVMTRSKVGEKTVRAIKASNDFFTASGELSRHASGHVRLKEKDLREILQSEFFDRRVVKKVSASRLARAVKIR